jgi:hypothetical protein
LSVTICTIFSGPTNKTTSLNNLYNNITVFEASDASTVFKKTVPLGQYTKKLIKVLLF